MYSKKVFQALYTIIFCVSVIGQAWSQSPAEIRGTVRASDGMPLPAVNVSIKGKSVGTVTDFDGNYTIRAQAGDFLVFSSLGFETVEKEVSGQSVLDVTLEEDVEQLSEVVVVGYGTQKKSDLTGAVSSLKAKDFNPGSNVSVDQMIQGRVSGVQVSQTSSEPGGGMSIRIRGASSVNAGNEPLYVIDGFPIDNSPMLAGGGAAGTAVNNNPRNPLNSLNPNDIESIEILKDASATAIYGSRGANGVILITTKRGSAQRISVNYDAYIGVQSVAKKMDLLSAGQYMHGINGISQDGGGTIIFTDEDREAIGNGVDWQDKIYRSAPVHSQNLSVSGGDDKTTFYTSFNYFDQQGIIDNSGIQKYIGRINLTRKLHDKIDFGINLTTSLVDDNNSVDGMSTNEDAGPIYTALLYDPTAPVYNDDGSFNQSSNLTINNPVSLIKGVSSKSKTNRTFGNVFFEYKITDALKTRLNFGSDRQTSRRDLYNSTLTFRGDAAGGIANISTLERSNVLLEYTVSYTRAFNENHSIDALGGVTYQKFNTRSFSGNITGFPSDDLGTDNLSLGDTNNDNLYSNHEENSLISYLGRINYQLYGKYLFTATLRADGSSRFGDNNKFGYFPSLALAWKLTEEEFVPEVFSNLKLRASWGQTGNQEISNYAALSTYESSTTAIINDGAVTSLRPSRIANPDLKWETTEQYNIGVDAGLWKGRLTGALDYFVKNTSDVLLNQPLPQSTGYSTILSNIGEVRNSGIEAQLSAVLVESDDFTWNTSVNFSRIRNKVTDLGEIGDIYTGSVANVGNTSILKEGHPAFSYYGYVVTGIFQENDDIAQSPQPNSQPGYPVFRDINGDGSITTADQTIIGDPYPDFTYGIHSSLNYKDFQLDVFFQGQHGGDLLNINVIESMYPGNFRRNRLAGQVLDRWTPENPSARWPSGVEPSSYGGGKVNTLVLQDATYFRLKNIQLSYTLRPEKIVDSARFYIAGQNLFTRTDYTGFDPEANSFGRSNARVDYSSYPLARTWMFGVNLSF
ncbi:TonB-linked outer membrane protein, SusC/RagA family [Sinomicrobium oceani]|uniref:TonB-linked outer membrane protein, SusC/RagA family n=1 Tax=Sinomicrobium oceani TaxID=1150368 RepID=A0A1K1QGP9_9FLAO|nr:TonB-dependent receptor [Sinomicrobium oceani]SFW59106.1 TonB-linked outer membrane protein, SusC/RagA family [Sinomicrobium oceani]